jgi:molybdopterin converting factor small subunit
VGELQREVPDNATVAGVWVALARDYPAIAPYAESMSCAVNADYARMSAPVNDGDEVAFLPPVSGG